MNLSKIICAVLALLLLFGTATRVWAATPEELEQQIGQLEREQEALQALMEELEAKLAGNFEEMTQLVARKDTIDRQISLLNENIENTQTQIRTYGMLAADTQEQLEQARERLDSLNEKYRERIRAMEEQGPVSYWSVLFHARSFTDFLDRLNMVREIAQADQRRLEELEEAARAVEESQAQLLVQKKAVEDKRRELESQQGELEAKREEANEVLRLLVARDAEFQALLEESEKKQEILMKELAQKQDEYDEALYLQWLESYKPPEDDDSAQDIPVDDSQWITPVSGYVLTSPFGMRMHPILGYERMHNGVDMACQEGTPIYASRGGLVEVADYQEYGAGNYIQINHGDGFRSVYMHMTNYVVEQGSYVAPGQLIGYVGNTGLSKGAHLHFGISYNGSYVNPMEYIG